MSNGIETIQSIKQPRAFTAEEFEILVVCFRELYEIDHELNQGNSTEIELMPNAHD